MRFSTVSYATDESLITVTASRRDWYELALTLYRHPSGLGFTGEEPMVQDNLRTALEDHLLGEPVQ